MRNTLSATQSNSLEVISVHQQWIWSKWDGRIAECIPRSNSIHHYLNTRKKWRLSVRSIDKLIAFTVCASTHTQGLFCTNYTFSYSRYNSQHFVGAMLTAFIVEEKELINNFYSNIGPSSLCVFNFTEANHRFFALLFGIDLGCRLCVNCQSIECVLSAQKRKQWESTEMRNAIHCEPVSVCMCVCLSVCRCVCMWGMFTVRNFPKCKIGLTEIEQKHYSLFICREIILLGCFQAYEP